MNGVCDFDHGFAQAHGDQPDLSYEVMLDSAWKSRCNPSRKLLRDQREKERQEFDENQNLEIRWSNSVLYLERSFLLSNLLAVIRLHGT